MTITKNDVRVGQIFEVTYKKTKKFKMLVTAVDIEPDTEEPVCFLISTKGIGQISYCEDLINHSRLLTECSTWQEAASSSIFSDRILN